MMPPPDPSRPVAPNEWSPLVPDSPHAAAEPGSTHAERPSLVHAPARTSAANELGDAPLERRTHMSAQALRSGRAGASGTVVRLLRFALVGASGFAVDIAVYFALQWAGLDHRVARFVSFWPAASWNWLLNRRWTFSERAPDARAGQWARFVASSVVGLALNAGSYAVLTTFTGFFDRHRMLALVFGVGLGGLVNFALATRYVYRWRLADRHRVRPGRFADAPPRTGGP